MDDHHFLINDKRWLWRYSPLRGIADGWTDYVKRKILIHKGLRGRKRLEIELHEGLHATLGHTISEETVTESARDLAKILWALGYRIPQ